MQTLTLFEAQQHLDELVRGLYRKGELLITDEDKPVAKLSPVAPPSSLKDLHPTSVGAVLKPYPCPEDDLLGEMLTGDS